jgi:hypothetical protein
MHVSICNAISHCAMLLLQLACLERSKMFDYSPLNLSQHYHFCVVVHCTTQLVLVSSRNTTERTPLLHLSV